VLFDIGSCFFLNQSSDVAAAFVETAGLIHGSVFLF
jgi:hypothetical protein